MNHTSAPAATRNSLILLKYNQELESFSLANLELDLPLAWNVLENESPVQHWEILF